MKYPYYVRLEQYEDGTAEWVARSECLKHCIGVGETPDDAVKELAENEIGWLEAAEELGIEIPPVPMTEHKNRKRTMARPQPAVQPA